jgi:hypothetical protein
VAQHALTKSRSKHIRQRGLLIRCLEGHLEIHFGFTARPWPTIWKRLSLAGLAVSITHLGKPVLRVDSNLDALLAAIEPRSSKRKSRYLNLWAASAGFCMLMTAVFVPIPTHQTKSKPEPKTSNPCSVVEIQKVISGTTENSQIEFLKSETFGGVTSGALLCEGVKYSYALESRGLERVLKVRKLDS